MSSCITSMTWQDLLNLLTRQASHTGVLTKIKSSQEHSLKFQICYENNKPYLDEWISTKIKIDTKSSSKSAELRIAGNEIYKKGKDEEALNFYNLSTAAAPYNTNDFALAVSNRSAVLGRLNYFKEAVRDIDLAFQHGNDTVPRRKLLIRKAILLHKLFLYKDALQIFKSLFPSEDEIRSNENNELKCAYFDSLQKIKHSKGETSNPVVTPPLPKGGVNKIFPSASAHVSLKYLKEKGRHVIADENFEKFDIIFVEKPFALVVLPDQYKQHCHHCCKRIVAFIPCKECTGALFCSEQCCDVAWSQYHQWECKGLELCHSTGVAHLGFRVALMADTSDQYQQVHDLVSHIDDMDVEDIYQYSTTAALLTLYLEQHTLYFSNHPLLKVEEMGCRIMRHIAQLICNGHAITKIDTDNSSKGGIKTATEEQIRVATAIYPSASMMNHSCDQNIQNGFINEYLVVSASRPIKKGEEVFNCYGPSHKTMSTEKRQQALQSQYFFTCKCPWCSQPSKGEYQQFSALQCQFCFGPVMPNNAGCADCGRGQPLTQLMDMALVAHEAFNKGQQFFKTGDMNKALTFLDESVKLSSKCLYRHNSDLRHYKDFLARTYVELERYNESIAIVEDCIVSVETQYGKDSLELSNELAKLCKLVLLSLESLQANGKQNSEEFRLNQHKYAALIKKIAGANVNSNQVRESSELSDSVNRLKINN